MRFLEILVVPRHLKKVNFFPKRPTTLKISDMKPWNLLFWKKLSMSLLPRFVWKSQTIKGTFLSFSLIKEWMNIEYVIELWCFWRTSESHYSPSSWYILKIPFIIEQRIVEVLGLKFWAMWVPWGKTLIFLSPLGSLKF